MTLTCRTCGGAPGHHRPSMLDPSGVGDPGHRMTGSKPCETCGGSGYDPRACGSEIDCPTCHGAGVQPQPTPPSTEDEQEREVYDILSPVRAVSNQHHRFEYDGDLGGYRFSAKNAILALVHRHTAEVLKGLREKRTTVDNLDVIFWHEVVQLIAAEEQAMKGEKA